MMAGQCHSRLALLLRALEAMLLVGWLLELWVCGALVLSLGDGSTMSSSVRLNGGSDANSLGGSTTLAAGGVVASTSAMMPSLAQLKQTLVQLHHAFAVSSSCLPTLSYCFARNEFSWEDLWRWEDLWQSSCLVPPCGTKVIALNNCV
jgi:hypothetical protein